jgi:intracellular septation protein
MKQLLEFAPIALFFIVYQLDGETIAIGGWEHVVDGIFTATAVLIAATAVQVLISRLMSGSWEKRTLWTFFAVALFGGATLLLRDQTFIQWKPTIFNWGLAIVFLGFQLFSERTLLERTVGQQVPAPAAAWRRINLLWIGNFAIVGALNLYVAYSYSEAFWVSYKLYSAIGFTLLLTLLTALMMSPYLRDTDEAAASQRGD